MSNWNIADIFETVAAVLPNKPAQIHGDRVFDWRTFDNRANAMACAFLDAGLSHQSKVSVMLSNCPEYLETYYAAFKASLIPVNTNYRYGSQELLYLWGNSDTEAVVFHARYTDIIASIRTKLPLVKRWFVVSDNCPEPEWATPYKPEPSAERPAPPWARSGDDLLFLYTGGTTGIPKGVMWRQDDLFQALGGGSNRFSNIVPITSLDDLANRLSSGDENPNIPACPLMHGTGQFGAFMAMWNGRTIICLQNHRFDSAELWNLVDRHRVATISIVGDAFSKPMLEHLKTNHHNYDLSCIEVIVSSGTMWSKSVKDELLPYLPQAFLVDSLGSSEAVGLGSSITTANESIDTAKFTPGENMQVITEDNKILTSGSNEIGMVAIKGFLPLGYYKDADKTARTFRTVAGVRYSFPGDFARVEDDSSITLLGRGSLCINTGGEKVFPEEVEEILKLHPNVVDSMCIGLPDKRFGQAICAVIERENHDLSIALDELQQLVKKHLASFKMPRYLRIVKDIGRAPNGKADYSRHLREAKAFFNLDK